jgi:hypothetical protein
MEIRSMLRCPPRGEYVVGELFSRLKMGEVLLELEDMAEACMLWGVLNMWGRVVREGAGVLGEVVTRVLPEGSRWVAN